MTVAAWIESMSKFDPAMDVVVRISYGGDELLAVATKPIFTVDAGCSEDDALCIDMADEDEGIEEESRERMAGEGVWR